MKEKEKSKTKKNDDDSKKLNENSVENQVNAFEYRPLSYLRKSLYTKEGLSQL